MENLNESQSEEILKTNETNEETLTNETTTTNKEVAPKKLKKTMDWLKLGVVGSLACSMISVGLSCTALLKNLKKPENKNYQSSSSVNYGSNITISDDGYFVIDGTKTNIKADGTSNKIVDAQTLPVDKWGISTYIKFIMSDGSYIETEPKTQVMNDHFYDASSADDLQELIATHKVPKIRLTNNINVTTTIEVESNVEINLNNKTMTYSANEPIAVNNSKSMKLTNGNISFNTQKALTIKESASLEIADTTISTTGIVAELLGNNSNIVLCNSSITASQNTTNIFRVLSANSNINIKNSTVSTTGKFVDVADSSNNFSLNYNNSNIESSDAGKTYVATKEDFISSITNTDITHITLSSSIDLESALYITRALTVNLNGKTLTAINDTVGDGIFCVKTGGVLTIEGDGTINSASQANDYSMAIWATEGGEVIINGGTFTNVGAKSHDGTAPNNNELIYVSKGGKVTINDGTFIGNTSNQTYGARFTLNSKDENKNTPARESGDIIVRGGIFYSYNPAESHSENPITNFVAFGYKVVENNGIYSVTEAAGHLHVSNAADFVNAVANTEVSVITVSSNINLETALYITRALTVNLNGKTLTAINDTVGDGIFCVKTGGVLTIEGDGTINSASQANDYSMAIWATEGGEVIINGGTFTNVGAKSHDGTAPNNNELIYVSKGGKVTINGGTFIGNTSNQTYGARFTLNSKDENKNTPARESGDIIVRGGSFHSYNPSESHSENPITNFVAFGYKVVENNGIYSVTEAAGHLHVSNAADFVNAVANTNVLSITISSNIDLETALYITRELTVNLNGKTLTAINDTVGDGIFCVKTGGVLTIEGDGTINSASQANDYSMAIWATEGGEVIINGGTFTNVGAKSHDGTAPNNNELIYVSKGGKVTINDGTFIGNTSNSTHGTKYTLNSKDEDKNTPERESGDIIVRGGSFHSYNPSESHSENPVANFIATGYTFIENNGIFTIVAE